MGRSPRAEEKGLEAHESLAVSRKQLVECEPCGGELEREDGGGDGDDDGIEVVIASNG